MVLLVGYDIPNLEGNNKGLCLNFPLRLMFDSILKQTLNRSLGIYVF